MKKVLILFIALITFSNANAGEFELGFKDINAVKILGNFKVTLKKGTEEKVRVINNDEKIIDEKILCEKKGKELILRIKGDTYKERDIEIVVTYINLIELTSKYGCRAEVKGKLTGGEIVLNSESGGKIKCTVDCDFVQATINTGGSIRVLGESKKARYKIGAGGTIAAANNKVKEVNAIVTAGGEVICAAIDKLTIKITSGGNVSYLGDPKEYEESIKLGGKINKMKSE